MDIKKLEAKARDIRFKALDATVRAGFGHLGGTFSCVEILVALYYTGVLNIFHDFPDHPGRDRFILSKGHACLALWPILVDLGIMDEEKFMSYGENGGFGGQLDVTMQGVDWNTGSLGHSLGICAGMALAAKLNNKNSHAFTLIGDAECDEGSFWEAINFVAQNKLKNITCIVDRNRLSVTDVVDDFSLFSSPRSILYDLGWQCYVINGHRFEDLFYALNAAEKSDRPAIIIANTIKGKGVSFMENEVKWHHGGITEKELEIAREELSDVNN